MSTLQDVYRYVEFMTGNRNFDCDKNKKIGYRFYHSRLVANLCIYILENCSDEDIPCEEKNTMESKKEIICIAGLLHDIKKNEKHHADKAADSLNDIFKGIAFFNSNKDILRVDNESKMIIENMIRKHGSHGSEDELYKFYIKLIQDADNLSGYVNYMPEEVFNNIFNIKKEKDIFYNPKEKVKEKHKNLNYMISKHILKIYK